MKWSGVVVICCLSLFLSGSFHSVYACKDIIACGEATEGDCNLMLKIRDPSRPGFQVLTMVPKGYSYNYHHPWTGQSIPYQFHHSMIGVATLGDTIPEIVKAGMCVTSAGLCFGDADTITNWKNPVRFAWDDFDWMRYAAQTASNEDHAVDLLTKDVVDQLHAPGVPENLFVVGPTKGYVVEADVIHYDVTEVFDSVAVMSNYAKNLWDESFLLRMIAPSFDATFEGKVTKGQVVRLGRGCIYGVKVIDIGPDYIEVRQIPIQLSIGNIIGRVYDLFTTIKVNLSMDETVGFYQVGLHDVSEDTATIRLCYEYYAWEQELLEHVTPSIGTLNVTKLIDLSRLHTDDLNGLRSMCDDHEIYPYEGAMIYRIPSQHYEMLSEGWFSTNHPCSSIYVPVHICVNDIFDPYESGDAAELSLELLKRYGHDTLTEPFQKIEQVFINEFDGLKPILSDLIQEQDYFNVSLVLTDIDYEMQKQAFLTQQLYLNISKNDDLELFSILSTIWDENYSKSLQKMQYFLDNLNQSTTSEYLDNIIDLSDSISTTKISISQLQGHVNKNTGIL